MVNDLSVTTHPEALEIDAASKSVFANIAESNEVLVIDTVTKTISAHWKLTTAADNVPLAYDNEDKLLYIACRKPGTLIVMDAATGKVVASLPAASGADDLFYDPAMRRVYVICGTGEVDTYQIDEAKHLYPLEILHTADGAKTALFVPGQNLLYVALPGVNEYPAEIRVYSSVKIGLSR